jgi:TetR/AcrR family transcriptional regulator, transcriptional repressor for nem operon
MPRMARSPANSETPGRILDVAERLVQTHGFNSFSYADIAQALHVTKASLHYHFPTKAKLGERLIERYRAAFLNALDRIDRTEGTASRKLAAYVRIYEDVLARNRMCLCGMMAADYATLPRPMKEEVRRFFDLNETWLIEVLKRGRDDAELAFQGPPAEAARVLVAALEGAMLLARSLADPSRLHTAAKRLLADIGVHDPDMETTS